jgi:SAM-dependent methyltransferase
MSSSPVLESSTVKRCCARFYDSDVATWLLGESFHPGGLKLTARLGERLALTARDRVLDVAAGRGASAFLLAERFGCEVTGVDYGEASVQAANAEATSRGLAQRVRFHHADAESLPFAESEFDALICECAFCTFPDKPKAAQEFVRVLRTGGQLGLTDLTSVRPQPTALEGLIGWIACVAGARSIEEYVELLEAAGFTLATVHAEDSALKELVRSVTGRLLAAEILTAREELQLPGLDFAQARVLAKAAADAVERRHLGYVMLVARKALTPRKGSS